MPNEKWKFLAKYFGYLQYPGNKCQNKKIESNFFKINSGNIPDIE